MVVFLETLGNFLYCLFQDHFYANASANTVQSRNRDPANILDRELLNDH